eukprot:PhM_4_TR3407/c1_g1_i2/m.83330/K20858/MCU; calcium uniporter protein, mitochondrial
MMRRTLFRAMAPMGTVHVQNTADYLTKIAREKNIPFDQAQASLASDATLLRYHVPGQIDVIIHDAANVTQKLNAAMSVSALSGHKKTLVSQLAEKRVELAKLKVTKAAIDAQAEKSPDRVALLTFLFLAAQWAVLFNWVFITFDWNLVEPITYFIGYTVVWLSIVHYYATGQEYTYDNVRQALADRKRRSLMKKANFDLDAFLKLDADVKTLEADVAALENID